MRRISLLFAICGVPYFGCTDEESNPDSGTGGGASMGDGGAPTMAGSGGSSTGGRSSGGRPPVSDACTIFPSDNAWNRDVSDLPVHPNSDNFVASVGVDGRMHPDFGTVWDGAPIGIPFVVVNEATPAVAINYTDYGDESDQGPFPIPLTTPIEGGPSATGDRHAIAVDLETCKLYELFHAFPQDEGWDASSGAAYDLSINEDHPEGCTSADAAGLPIFPGLVRYDEVVENREIRHALRFTVARSQRAYIYPARHFASSDTDPNLPPMGLRFRMKATYDCSSFSDEVQVICNALKAYGMIMADNGSNWYLSGTPDDRWNDSALADLKSVPGSAFEVVDTGAPIVTDAPDCSIP